MTKALIVIDVQESFRARPADWQAMQNPQIAETVNNLVAARRQAGDLVIWVLHAEPGSDGAFDPARGAVRLLEPLRPEADEPLLTKTTINAFTSTNLQELLTAHAITDLAICGIRTEQCCETTARLAADLGYRVTFLRDATTTSPIGGLSAEQLIERTATVLAGREFAAVTTVADYLADGVPA